MITFTREVGLKTEPKAIKSTNSLKKERKKQIREKDLLIYAGACE